MAVLLPVVAPPVDQGVVVVVVACFEHQGEACLVDPRNPVDEEAQYQAVECIAVRPALGQVNYSPHLQKINVMLAFHV